MITSRLLVLLFSLTLLTGVGTASTITVQSFDTEIQQTRYNRLIYDLRCPVCQGQSIGESNAGLAKDLRDRVRSMILAGQSDDQIAAYMVSRYGEFVLYEPPVRPATYLLWVIPFLVALIGFGVTVIAIKKRGRRSLNNLQAASRADETKRADELLSSIKPNSPIDERDIT
tara:strand:- start:95 stop:607 length:513 start_codon:yes stop_codon:yes gene_type:complete